MFSTEQLVTPNLLSAFGDKNQVIEALAETGPLKRSAAVSQTSHSRLECAAAGFQHSRAPFIEKVSLADNYPFTAIPFELNFFL
jgi:hypothetical protein